MFTPTLQTALEALMTRMYGGDHIAIRRVIVDHYGLGEFGCHVRGTSGYGDTVEQAIQHALNADEVGGANSTGYSDGKVHRGDNGEWWFPKGHPRYRKRTARLGTD